MPSGMSSAPAMVMTENAFRIKAFVANVGFRFDGRPNWNQIISATDLHTVPCIVEQPHAAYPQAGIELVEGLVHFVGQFDIESSTPSSVFLEEFEGWGLTIMPAAKVYPLADVLPPWVQPYGMFGVGFVLAYVEDDFGILDSDTDAAAAFRFGGGVDFYIIPQLVVRAGAGYVLGVPDAPERVHGDGGLP